MTSSETRDYQSQNKASVINYVIKMVGRERYEYLILCVIIHTFTYKNAKVTNYKSISIWYCLSYDRWRFFLERYQRMSLNFFLLSKVWQYFFKVIILRLKQIPYGKWWSNNHSFCSSGCCHWIHRFNYHKQLAFKQDRKETILSKLSSKVFITSSGFSGIAFV